MQRNHAAQDVAYVKERHPEVTRILGDFKFRGQGQKKTPVADLRSAVELTFLLPGRHAARIRRQAAELLCRYLGGDLALVDEVCRNRGFQKEKNPGPEKRQFLIYLNVKNSIVSSPAPRSTFAGFSDV